MNDVFSIHMRWPVAIFEKGTWAANTPRPNITLTKHDNMTSNKYVFSIHMRWPVAILEKGTWAAIP